MPGGGGEEPQTPPSLLVWGFAAAPVLCRGSSGRLIRLENPAETLRALLVSSCAEIIVNGSRKRREILFSLKAA